jgi:methionine synthase II (cobalamin-independent)
MNILIPGQYPRSEKLVEATRNFDRNRLSLQDLEKQRTDDEKKFKSLQWGLPYISTGLFNWQDLLRPFVDLLPGSKAETLKRFFETNSFWRLLEVENKTIGAERWDANKLDAWIDKYFLAEGHVSKEDALILTLPFLFLFKEYSEGITIEQIAHLLEAVVEKLNKFPNAILCFAEPSFGWKPLTEQEKAIGKAFLEKIKKKSHLPIYMFSYFFPLEKDLDYIYGLPLDGIGIDFYCNDLEKTLKHFPKDKTLMAGILSTESTLIESSQNIEHFIQMINRTVPHTQLYLTPSGPAELLPRVVMDSKVKNLQEILLCLLQSS